MARLVKKNIPDCIVLLGGGHATHQAELILQNHPEVDIVVTGEAEQTLPELLALLRSGGLTELVPGLVIRKNGGILRTAASPPVRDLDKLPFASMYLYEAINLNVTMQAEFISSSRGCPAACSFCSSPSFWGRKVRYRSVDSVLQEIRFIRDNYGLIYFSLRDDTFMADRRRTVELCRKLIEDRLNIFWNCQSRAEGIDPETLGWMRRAGCECIQLGVESGSPEMLQLLGKKIHPGQIIKASGDIHSAGIQLSTFLITGIPEEKETDMEQTINLIRQIQPDDLQIAPLAYYPGTRLFETSVKNNRLDADIFEICTDDAVLAVDNGHRLVKKMLLKTERYRHSPDIRLLLEINKKSGYSAVNSMQAGDKYAAEGKMNLAEEQYQQICRNEPDHPWGWYLLGELYEQTGKPGKAARSYRRVLELVPRHGPSAERLSIMDAR